MLIGLSLSACVKDMLEGKVEEEEVMCILTGTNAKTVSELLEVLTLYCVTYWKADAARAVVIVRRLIERRRLVQLRVHGFDAPNTARGHWAVVSSLMDLRRVGEEVSQYELENGHG